MQIVDWESAELLAASHMRWLGYADAWVTPRGADGGIDIRGSGVAAQVKYYANPVGGPDVQRIRGALGMSGQALFYSLSGYTRNAQAAAQIAQVALFTFNHAGNVRPDNPAAHELQAAAERPSHGPGSLQVADRARIVLSFVDQALGHRTLIGKDARAVPAGQMAALQSDFAAGLGAVKVDLATLRQEIVRLAPELRPGLDELADRVDARIDGGQWGGQFRHLLSRLAWLCDDWGRLQARVAHALGQRPLIIEPVRGPMMTHILQTDGAI